MGGLKIEQHHRQRTRLRWKFLLVIIREYPKQASKFSKVLTDISWPSKEQRSMLLYLMEWEFNNSEITTNYDLSREFYCSEINAVSVWLEFLNLQSVDWALFYAIQIADLWLALKESAGENFQVNVESIIELKVDLSKMFEYPQGAEAMVPCQLPAWYPARCSWAEYKKQTFDLLVKYQEEVKSFYIDNGVIWKYLQEENNSHFQWLAWKVVDRLSLRDMETRYIHLTQKRRLHTAFKNALDELGTLLDI